MLVIEFVLRQFVVTSLASDHIGCLELTQVVDERGDVRLVGLSVVGLPGAAVLLQRHRRGTLHREHDLCDGFRVDAEARRLDAGGRHTSVWGHRRGVSANDLCNAPLPGVTLLEAYLQLDPLEGRRLGRAWLVLTAAAVGLLGLALSGQPELRRPVAILLVVGPTFGHLDLGHLGDLAVHDPTVRRVLAGQGVEAPALDGDL
ncbi:MAG: hypothetical protein H6717_03140 [Polyangiaceae bacterium]|nr:hypothetical protein [Polyangiaceae bacterium]